MANLISALGIERELIADKLAASIAKLLTDSGLTASADSIRATILDPNTTIAFPSFTLNRVADVVVVEVVVTEVVVISGDARPTVMVRREIRKPSK